MVTIYLAGGMRSNWRDEVRGELGGGVRYIDPRENGTDVASAYTFLDLDGIDRSDVVLGYMEGDNPSGLGLALEVGYARGIGKMIIFVDGQRENKYLGMVREVSDVVFETLGEAIEFMRVYVGRGGGNNG